MSSKPDASISIDAASYFAIRIDSFEGSDTYLRCGDDEQDFLYCVVKTLPDGTAEIIDSAYRSYDELADAWPEVRRTG